MSLHPAGATLSFANDTDGTIQVGSVQFQENANTRAALWRGSATGWAELTPTALGYSAGTASAADAGRQVGFAWKPGVVFTHGMLWRGTAASATELSLAAGFTSARGWDVKGEQVVGVSFTNQGEIYFHATLWTLGDQGAVVEVDLTPEGFTDSDTNATNGVQRVGTVTFGAPETAEATPPSGAARPRAGWTCTSGCLATDVAAVVHRFSSAAVPEPSGVMIVRAGAAALTLRRRRRS